MPLPSGTRLGPYEVTAPLGAGGMGEVYRARDTRLGRDVAIKVLPEHLSANADVRARFEREARTISSLNHPHICTLFDVGRSPVEGVAAEVDYLVMELVEGDTLAQRLAKGRLPIADVLRIGAQIADALDRAHRAGVVHRDLKPGNVMLTRSGAKLMDFGLARATDAAGPVSGSGATLAALTQNATVASPLTAQGAIVGTFQYMAPEQLEGREADARSDLWALGCVLYEMATGQRAFDGRSQASLITAIMGSQPAPLAQLAPMSPPALERVVSALLAKDADDRIQTAHDVKLQLGWLAEPGSQTGSASAAGVPAIPVPRGKRPPFVAIAIGTLVVAVAAVAGWLADVRPSPTVVTLVPMPRDMKLPVNWGAMAISPQGDRVVAAGQMGDEPWKLWLWRLDSPDPTPMSGARSTGFLCWSADGRSVAYTSFADKGLNRITASGGAETRLCGAPDPRGLSWGSQDVIVFAPTPSGPLMRIPAAGGTPEPVTELDASLGESGHRFPSFLPDGEHFLFSALPRDANGYTIRLGSLKSKQSRVVMKAQSGVSYVPPGYLVFVQDGKLTAQRFDQRNARCVGERFTLGDAPPTADTEAESPVSASQNGWLLHTDQRRPDARLEWLDRSGASLGAISLPRTHWKLTALSPDQTSALATSEGSLWQIDLERAVPTRLLSGINPHQPAQWSPDGRRIAATAHESGREVLRLINAGGSGMRDSVPAVDALFVEAHGWAHDGRSLLVAGVGSTGSRDNQDTSWDLYSVPLDGGPPVPYMATPAYERWSRLSPDGRWAAVCMSYDGKLDLVIDSYPVPGRRVQVLSGEPEYPIAIVWGRQGRELIYGTRNGQLLSLPLQLTGDVLRPGRPQTLFELPASISDITTVDGERFLVTRLEESAPTPRMRLVQNWAGLLKR